MKTRTKLSLLTLLGLLLPFGNIWGPYLMRVPVGSTDYSFRRRLVAAETIITCACLMTAILLNVKALRNGMDMELMTASGYVLCGMCAFIILIAVVFSIFPIKNDTPTTSHMCN